MGLTPKSANEDELITEESYGTVLNEVGILDINFEIEDYVQLHPKVNFICRMNDIRFLLFTDTEIFNNNAAVSMILAARQNGGAVLVCNEYKQTRTFNIFKSRKGVVEEFNRLKTVILFHNPTYILMYEGEANYG